MELEEFFKDAKKVLICGIGNDTRGDDTFGVYVVEKLKERISNQKVVFLNCGEMPESYAGKIIRENPSHVLFIDAVHFEGKPGEIVLADPEGTLGEAFSTHKMPLKLLVGYLKQNINAKFLLIGAQPKQTGLFVDMSKELKDSAERLVSILERILAEI
ncbi:MAG TPA: hydrogenase maturation peptidase HycI [Thermococcaceae archaeon]|uniref:Hydrogenase maturation protease n=1 Tax=Thermococcus sibiricus TaxID=172049 RepID=A0A101EK23_9EURY|nr:hydrogenase maturation peptidase HycI [Thermococcus sibiricus]KUK16803.1 MAG: Hydrogenase maturation protease [Thermococcus sibiricus]HII67858.1 hydrogenase maturation peptidase HycI [Thermococcaceae archaeon]